MMMDPGLTSKFIVTPFWSNVIVASGALFGAVAAFIKANAIAAKVDILKVELDGKLDRLLKLTEDSSFARGILEEKKRRIIEQESDKEAEKEFLKDKEKDK
jgi:hypothetical protein